MATFDVRTPDTGVTIRTTGVDCAEALAVVSEYAFFKDNPHQLDLRTYTEVTPAFERVHNSLHQACTVLGAESRESHDLTFDRTFPADLDRIRDTLQYHDSDDVPPIDVGPLLSFVQE